MKIIYGSKYESLLGAETLLTITCKTLNIYKNLIFSIWVGYQFCFPKILSITNDRTYIGNSSSNIPKVSASKAIKLQVNEYILYLYKFTNL